MKNTFTIIILLLSLTRAWAQSCTTPTGEFDFIIGPDGSTVSFIGTMQSCAPDVTVSWDFDDGSPVVSGAGLLTPQRIYSEEGSYNVTMKLTPPAPCQSSTFTFAKVVTISFAPAGVLWLDLEGPTLVAECQEVEYKAVVAGGTPPYSYEWDLGSSYAPQCPQVCGNSCVPFTTINSSFTAKFNETATNNINVKVTDALGRTDAASLTLKVLPGLVWPLEFFVNGSKSTIANCTGYDVNTVILFSPDISPPSTFTFPIQYRWEFGDGAVENDDSFGNSGFATHSYSVPGTYQVTFTVSDENGSMQAKKNVVVCGSAPPNPNGITGNCALGFSLLGVSNILIVKNYGQNESITHDFLLNTSNACDNAQNQQLNYKIKYKFPSCEYPETGLLNNTNTSGPGSFLFDLDGTTFNTATNNAKPWGYIDAIGYVYKTGVSSPCCTTPSARNYYIEPEPLNIESVAVTGSCQDYIITATPSGGAWKWQNGAKRYKDDYTWKVYHSVTHEELTGVLLTIPGDPEKGPRKRVNPAFFKNFDANQFVEFIFEVTTSDYANQQAKASDIIVFNPFRVHLKPVNYRCSGAIGTFDIDFPLATGGTEIYSYQWSNGLTGASPTFTAPVNGSANYTLTVTDGGNCTLTASTTVTVRQLATFPMAQLNVCQTNGEKFIGPDLLAIGGSGDFEYQWSAANPAHLTLLTEDFELNPILKDLTGTAVYTLLITDKYGGCTTTATYTITGYPNTIVLDAPATVSTCYGVPVTLAVGFPGSHGVLPAGYSTEWKYPTFPEQAPLQSTITGNLFVTELAAHYAGQYPFKVKVIQASTGCFAEKTINLNIRDRWAYEGFQSQVSTAVLGTAALLWANGGTTYPNRVTSPNITDPVIEWVGGTPYNLYYPPANYNNYKVPVQGKFGPTLEHPFITMKVTDPTTGCSDEFASMRYILSYRPPEITATVSPAVVCEGPNTLCVQVKFDPHLVGVPPTYMPLKVNATVSGFPSGNKKVVLYLINATGVYEGKVCVTGNFQYGGSPYPTLTVIVATEWF